MLPLFLSTMKTSNILITIMTCTHYQHANQAVRDTWLKKCSVDHVFYAGRGYKSDAWDEIVLDVDDDYEHVFEKTKAIFGVTLACGYDYILHAFVDTYVNVNRLLESGLFDKHYAGHRTHGGDLPHFAPIEFDQKGLAEYASGGAGTLLSSRAMRAVLKSDFKDSYDDLAIGTILARAGIPLYHDPRFQKHGPYLKPTSITTHLSRGTLNYDESWMYSCHATSR